VSLLLTAEGISKSFAGVRALRGVSFDLHEGEVHALIGENGAGKSTLIKVVTGAEKADAGSLTVGGQLVSHMDPVTSRALGIAAIYQQPSLSRSLGRGTASDGTGGDGKPSSFSSASGQTSILRGR
jgi:rhamnose transport system ATP-binding protein